MSRLLLMFIGSLSVHGGQAVSQYSQPMLSTAKPGDIERGKAAFLDRDRGHCLLCHQVQQLDAPFQGDLGPDLSTVGERLTLGEIRFRLVDSTRVNPNTVMPPYYRTTHLQQVAKEYVDVPILNAQEIEDVVIYLASLKSVNSERAE